MSWHDQGVAHTNADAGAIMRRVTKCIDSTPREDRAGYVMSLDRGWEITIGWDGEVLEFAQLDRLREQVGILIEDRRRDRAMLLKVYAQGVDVVLRKYAERYTGQTRWSIEECQRLVREECQRLLRED